MELILFIIVVILLFWIGSISGRVKDLEKTIKSLSLKSSKPAQTATEPFVHNEETLKPKTIFEDAPVLDLAAPITEPGSAGLMDSKPEKQNTKMSDAQQVDTASSWLNKIGVVALLFGMVFFFKYAIDQGWITPWMRIIIGFLVSGLLVYLGELWKEKYGSRAYALSGGGIALF